MIQPLMCISARSTLGMGGTFSWMTDLAALVTIVTADNNRAVLVPVDLLHHHHVPGAHHHHGGLELDVYDAGVFIDLLDNVCLR